MDNELKKLIIEQTIDMCADEGVQLKLKKFKEMDEYAKYVFAQASLIDTTNETEFAIRLNKIIEEYNK